MQGTIRLFKLGGIQVYLHMSWFLAAAYFVTQQPGSPVWAFYEFIAMFGIVLMHEFGHAFACRQVGGRADQIVLWPLGGVAFVDPPRRPGPVLWSIAAGPLVNVVLVPILFMLVLFLRSSEISINAYKLVATIAQINLVLLVFNLLPVYPLDGGQILRALLWFPLGEIRSLQVASVIGLIGGALLIMYAVMIRSFWWGLLALFVVSRAIAGWQQAKLMMAERAPRPDEAPPVPPQQ
jgi:Zn-dependent protease